MKKKEKGLLSLLLIGVLGTVAGLGVFGAFTSTTANPNNEFAAGTVAISDNDSNAALYSVASQKPGESITRCIRVSYTGSLPANVRMYSTSTIGALGPHVNLTIQPGTMPVGTAYPSCTGFTADSGGPLFNNTLSNFASTHNSYANGLVDYPGATTSWATNSNVVYQVTATLSNSAPDSVQGATTGQHTFTWEAQNQ
jgi:hypothetical protein